MADLSTAFKSYLQKLADLEPHLGVGVDSRVFLDLARQNQVKPFVVIEERAGALPENFGKTVGVAQGSYAVFAVASTRALANDIAEIIRVNCQLFGPGSMEGVWVHAINVLNYRDTGVDLAKDSSADHDYWTVLEMTIHHNLTNPLKT